MCDVVEGHATTLPDIDDITTNTDSLIRKYQFEICHWATSNILILILHLAEALAHVKQTSAGH